MSHDQLSAIISADREVQGGAPVFRGTRVPVQSLFDHLESGESIDDFFAGEARIGDRAAGNLSRGRAHGGGLNASPRDNAWSRP